MTEISADGVRTITTEFVVTIWPPELENCTDSRNFCCGVQYRGGGRWAVEQGWYSTGGMCYDRNGNLEYNQPPSTDDSDEPATKEEREIWLARFRFSREEALELASRLAPEVDIMGYTAREVLASHLAKHGLNPPKWC